MSDYVVFKRCKRWGAWISRGNYADEVGLSTWFWSAFYFFHRRDLLPVGQSVSCALVYYMLGILGLGFYFEQLLEVRVHHQYERFSSLSKSNHSDVFINSLSFSLQVSVVLCFTIHSTRIP